MITAVVVVLIAMPGPPVSTTALTPVVTAPLSSPPPRARSPPPDSSHRAAIDPAEGPVLPDLTESLSTEMQADGRVHDRMLDPNDRPDYEDNEGATTLRDREFS